MIDYGKLQFEVPKGVKYPESWIEGKRTERMFLDICKMNGYEVKKSEDYNDIYQHFDFYITKNSKTWRVDVKNEKKLNRWDDKSDKEIQWLELKGITGYGGWLYGKSDFIAFKYGESFILAKRKDLLDLTLKLREVDENSNPVFCKSKEKKLYQTLQRDGRQDEVILVKMEDIKTLKFKELKEKI